MATQASFSIQHSGPLPPPESLARYDQIHPGFADRIVKMAETEAEHRRAWEVRMLDAQVEKMRKTHQSEREGRACALLVALTFGICSTIAILNNHPIAGSFGSGVTIVALVTAFIVRQRATATMPPIEQKPSGKKPDEEERADRE